MSGGRYVWIDLEDIEAIKHISNNDLETKETYAVERIIEGYWGQPGWDRVIVECDECGHAIVIRDGRGAA